MRTILLSLLLAGCTTDWNAWDVGQRPVAAEGSDPAWTYRVDAVADMWAARLFESGCTTVYPFDGSAGTVPVYLLAEDVYDSFAGAPGTDGLTWTYRMNVLGTVADLTTARNFGFGTLAHEMGHALGLEHVSVADDPKSVMHPMSDGISEPSARDVEMVMDILGCR